MIASIGRDFGVKLFFTFSFYTICFVCLFTKKNSLEQSKSPSQSDLSRKSIANIVKTAHFTEFTGQFVVESKAAARNMDTNNFDSIQSGFFGYFVHIFLYDLSFIQSFIDLGFR